jgi:hypothetical protein
MITARRTWALRYYCVTLDLGAADKYVACLHINLSCLSSNEHQPSSTAKRRHSHHFIVFCDLEGAGQCLVSGVSVVPVAKVRQFRNHRRELSKAPNP